MAGTFYYMAKLLGYDAHQLRDMFHSEVETWEYILGLRLI